MRMRRFWERKKAAGHIARHLHKKPDAIRARRGRPLPKILGRLQNLFTGPAVKSAGNLRRGLFGKSGDRIFGRAWR